jgi:hypothetical protein
MIVLAYLGSRCTKFHAAGWACRFLRPFIWCRVSGLCDFAMDSTKEQHQILCIPLKECYGDHSNDQTSVRGRNMSRTRMFERDSRIRAVRKRREKLRADWRACLSFSLTSVGLLTKNPSWQAGQTANTAYYCDVLQRLRENVRRLHPELFCYNRTGCCITTTHHRTLTLSIGNILPEPTWLSSPTHSTFPCFPDWR